MSEKVDGSTNVKICESCGVNVYALPGMRHANEQYSRLADYCIENELFCGHDGSHTDSVVREIERLTAEVERLRDELADSNDAMLRRFDPTGRAPQSGKKPARCCPGRPPGHTGECSAVPIRGEYLPADTMRCNGGASD